jgi:hypothetical protein
VPASYLRQLYLTPGDGACEQGCTSGSPAIPGSDALNDMFAGRALRGAERDALAAGTSPVFDPALFRDGSIRVEIEEGPDDGSRALLIVAAFVTLVGVAISVALSAAEGRADLATLAAVGAPPRRRRALATSQALLVAGLGSRWASPSARSWPTRRGRRPARPTS